MKFKYSKEFAIGLSVIAALVVTYFGIEYLKGNNVFKPANYYYATYNNVAGLQQSAPVTVNGYKVGLVTEIAYQYDNPGHIRAELSLDKELKLPKGTKAMLVTDMLGTASISLQMGNNTDFIEIGSEIAGDNAKGLMSNVTNDILPSVSQIIPKIDSLVTSLNALASNPTLTSSLTHLNKTLANIEASSAQLTKVMAKMPYIANDATTVMSNVKTITNDLSMVSSQMKTMPLQTTMDNIEKTSESLRQLMNNLNNQNSSLGLLLNDAELYNNLNNASASLDSLLKDVKKNPKRYISIKLL